MNNMLSHYKQQAKPCRR